MSKERTDEFLKWRGLLDQPDAGLDEGLDDREATWHKLAGRLGERRRNRLYGYRIAAACLLFVLIIPASRLFPDRHTATGTHRPGHDSNPSDQRRTAHSGDHQASATAARQRSAPDLSSDPERPAPSDPFRPAAAGQQRPFHEADAVTPTTDQRRSSRQAQETAWRALVTKAPARKIDKTPLAALIDIGSAPAFIIAAPPDPATQSLFPPSSPPKQLRVVHQNEIRGGSIPSPAVGVTGTGRLIDLFRPFPQQPSSAAPPAEDPVLLKIKLSPSN